MTNLFSLVEKPSSKDAPLFIWRLSTITPTLIRETVLRSGFRLIKESSTNTNWIATWCKHLKTYQYADLNSNQKVNHFPGKRLIERTQLKNDQKLIHLLFLFMQQVALISVGKIDYGKI